MRIRRRATEPSAEAAPVSVDTAPAGRPVAVFAGVLDGRRLWVALDARPGTIALRETVSGDVVAPPDDSADDQPAYLAARLDLAALPAAPATYDVVLVPPGSGRARPLWTPPLPAHRPPPGPDGRTRHLLTRSADGTLQLRSEALPDAVDLVAVGAEPDALTLRLAVPGTTLELLGDDDAVLATWPTRPDGDGAAVDLAVEPLTGLEPQVGRLVLDGVPVRRRDNDLDDPGRAAPLPQLYDGESDRPRLRLRWSGQGALHARVLATGTPSEEASA